VSRCEASGVATILAALIFQRLRESWQIRISNCSKLILITRHCISRRLVGSGPFGLVLITAHLAWMHLNQSCGFGSVRTRIMTSSSNRGSSTNRWTRAVGSAFLNLRGAEEGALIRAAASTLPLGCSSSVVEIRTVNEDIPCHIVNQRGGKLTNI
jgi:hypothetical protein